MKVSIIIPVFNEAQTVAELLEQVWAQSLTLEKEIIIVESNSTDGSRELVQKFAKEKEGSVTDSVLLILQEKPRGKGFAVREGFKNATGDIILIQDADLEYDVTDYPKVLQPIIDGSTSFVLGSRHVQGDTRNIRKFEGSPIKARFMNFGAVLFHTFFNVLYGVRLTDPTTMFKVFKRSCLDSFTLSGNRFDLDFELLGKLIRAGFHPIEVPISYKSRSFAEGKKIRIILDPLLWIRIILKTRLSPLKSRY
jgi:glycosyltransferase involved in cell wall biosynthesis